MARGVRRGLPSMDFGYAMPPLWGPDSFNDGAGMARLTAIANFVHFNMPHGADYLNPQLTVEQAWDVAAYVVSKPRPAKAGLDKDFPDLLQKPVDAPYGPYADNFTELQHKYGLSYVLVTPHHVLSQRLKNCALMRNPRVGAWLSSIVLLI